MVSDTAREHMEPSAGYTGYLIQFLSSEKIDVVACFGNEGAAGNCYCGVVGSGAYFI